MNLNAHSYQRYHLLKAFLRSLPLLVFAAMGLQACSKIQELNPKSKKNSAPKAAVLPPKPKPKPVTNRPGNRKGDLFAIEYHRITPKEVLYARSIENFKRDLESLYHLGFRPVTVSEMIEGKMNLPPGASPVALTFDDSSIEQFKVLQDGSIDPDCAVGIMQTFSKKYPDWPLKATFYILPPTPFGQKAWVGQKIALLKKWGCEIGSHTISHRSLRAMSLNDAQKELGASYEWIQTFGITPKTMAVPYGSMPKEESILKDFQWNGKKLGYKANLRSMGRPARSFLSEKPENPLRFPRILGDDQQFALTYWLKKVENGEVVPYTEPREGETEGKIKEVVIKDVATSKESSMQKNSTQARILETKSL